MTSASLLTTAHGVASGEEGGSTGRAEACSCDVLRQFDARQRESIDIRRLDRVIAKTTDIAVSEIIC